MEKALATRLIVCCLEVLLLGPFTFCSLQAPMLSSAEFICVCRVSRGLLGGIEWAYMKGVFDSVAIIVVSTYTVHVIFFYSLLSQVVFHGGVNQH